MVEYSPIPENVRELVRDRVHSIEHIEVLLTLQEQAPTTLRVDALAQRLRLDTPLVEAALSHLASHGLVVALHARAEWRYAPAGPELDAAVRDLGTCYADRRVEMLRIISTNAMERLRSGSLKIFAEAFRLRGNKKDG